VHVAQAWPSSCRRAICVHGRCLRHCLQHAIRPPPPRVASTLKTGVRMVEATGLRMTQMTALRTRVACPRRRVSSALPSPAVIVRFFSTTMVMEQTGMGRGKGCKRTGVWSRRAATCSQLLRYVLRSFTPFPLASLMAARFW
jgi:hypothetical protein